jgi:hypothetical protein
MIDPLLDLYAKNLAYTKHLLADVHTEQTAKQPAEAVNHPLWIVGHLATTSDIVAGHYLLGLSRQLPESWEALFGPQSTPVDDFGQYPPMNDLLTALHGAHAAVDQAARELKAEALADPTPFDRFRDRFPTLGHSLTHVLVGHENLHLGQLSAWRRVLGFEAVPLS